MSNHILLNIFELCTIYNIIYDNYLIIFYTYKLNFIGKITTYYNYNQVWYLF
jgi:hypothetical protein